MTTVADVTTTEMTGSNAVGIGRPYVYGLAAGGEADAREVLTNLIAEFDITMALAGCTSVGGITRETLADG